MCGIVGYVGKREALPVILSGLEKLEYRGYDSAGVALYENGVVSVTRALGKLSELKKTLEERPCLRAYPAHQNAKATAKAMKAAAQLRPSQVTLA